MSQINLNASENVKREMLPCLSIIHFSCTFESKILTATENKIFGQVYNTAFKLPL